MLVIDPDECIDCGVCVPECPADAIVPDNELEGDIRKLWENVNAKYAREWPNITEVREEDVPKDAEDWNGVENKLETHFSPNPGKGD